MRLGTKGGFFNLLPPLFTVGNDTIWDPLLCDGSPYYIFVLHRQLIVVVEVLGNNGQL